MGIVSGVPQAVPMAPMGLRITIGMASSALLAIRGTCVRGSQHPASLAASTKGDGRRHIQPDFRTGGRPAEDVELCADSLGALAHST